MNNFSQLTLAEKEHFEIHPAVRFNTFRATAGTNRSSSYDIIWIKNGSGCFITTQEYHIENNIVYCFAPGTLREIANEQNVDGFHISIAAALLYTVGAEFNFSFLAGKSKLNNEPVMITIDEETQDDMMIILTKMSREFNNYLSLRLEIIKGLFNIFLLFLSRKHIAKEKPGKIVRDEELVRKFLHLLPGNIKTKKMVSDYAIELNRTPGYLNTVVKKITGFTASYHIQQQIILEAKKQAIQSDCSMKEIAYGLGFDDIAHLVNSLKPIQE